MCTSFVVFYEDIWTGLNQNVLAPGMTIGIMAPASASDEDLNRIEEICNLRGIYSTLWWKCTSQRLVWRYTRGASRRVSIYDDHRTLWGGTGFTRWLRNNALSRFIRLYSIRKHRKAFIGYSDCTDTSHGVNRYSRLITYHGPWA